MKEFESDIRTGIEEGVIRNIDPHICAIMLSGLVNSLLFNWLHTDSDKRIIDLYQEATQLIRRGIYTGDENNESC